MSKSGASAGCDSPGENRAGDPNARTDSLLALHGNLSLRPRAGVLLAERGAVRQGGRLLHLERRACGVRAAAGAAVRRDVARAGISGPNAVAGTGPGARAVCAGRTGLVGEEVSGVFSGGSVCALGAVAGIAGEAAEDAG